MLSAFLCAFSAPFHVVRFTRRSIAEATDFFRERSAVTDRKCYMTQQGVQIMTAYDHCSILMER